MKTLINCLPLIVILIALSIPRESTARTIHIRRLPAVQTETFQVASNAKIAVGTNHGASLADVRVGDRVSLGFSQENGGSVVHRIADGVPHGTHTPAANLSVKTQSHNAGKSMLHTHGIVRSVNVETGTITIAKRLR